MSYSGDGSLLVTTNRDKKLRVWDLRQQTPVHEGAGHAGAKNSRAVWLGEMDRIATAGFSKMSDRQLGLWDLRNPDEPIGGFQLLDSISGVCMPFWDDGTKCLYLAGKGDGNIRYYEYANDDLVYLSEYKSGDPQRGIAFIPKRGVDVHENEVMRAYKTVNDSYIEPISFIVPRRAETFQSDIYPETSNGQPGLSASDWFGGKDAIPPKFDLGTKYSDDYVPEPTPVQAPKPEPAPAPVPVAVKKEIPSVTITQPEPTPEPKVVPTKAAEKAPEPKPVVESPKEPTPTPAPVPVVAESSRSQQATVTTTDLNSVLSNLQGLHALLAKQARDIAAQQDVCSKLIKEVEGLKQKLK
ncbi:Coronin [Dactylella cylindrospora]|nr:Coronin [Dactylella cylindrospora]